MEEEPARPNAVFVSVQTTTHVGAVSDTKQTVCGSKNPRRSRLCSHLSKLVQEFSERVEKVEC
jgi:hypothetical protein